MNRISILIIDDDPASRRDLEQALAQADGSFGVLAAASLAEARERLRACVINCVFVRMAVEKTEPMPYLPVSDILRDWPNAALVAVGSGDEREIVAAIRSGAADYISVPRLGALALRRAIENAICAARQEQDQRDLRARLNHLAMFDSRTGLPNRPLFNDRLAHALQVARRHRHGLAVMAMDFNGFRAINDRFGRPAGDDLLLQATQRAHAALRRSDTLARLQGDEFAALLPGIPSFDAAALVARKMIAAVGQPIATAGEQVTLGISVGIAMFPEDGAGPETLLDEADAAMYRAKREGSGYAFRAPPCSRSA